MSWREDSHVTAFAGGCPVEHSFSFGDVGGSERVDVFRFQIVVLVESLDLHVLGGLGIVIEQVDWTLLLSLFAKWVILAPVGTVLAVVYGGSHGGEGSHGGNHH